jgi:hypothetical protein
MPFLAHGQVLYRNQNGGIMTGPWRGWSPYEGAALNLIAGRRATCGNFNAPCNIGEFVNDLPQNNHLRFVDSDGQPLVGADVQVYRAAPGPVLYGKVIDNTPDLRFTTDSDGYAHMPRNPFSDGPIIPLGATNGVAAIRIEQAGRSWYRFIEVTDFNMEYWRGHTQHGFYRIELATPGSAAEIDVLGFGVSIANDDTTPSQTDHTDFGAVPAGGTITRQFVIKNRGGSFLDILNAGAPMVSGPNALDFILLNRPSDLVGPILGSGELVGFQVQFRPQPGASGLRVATVSIPTNDADEPVYRFAISGTASAALGGFAVSAGQASATPDDEGRAIVVDSAGNTYIAGTLFHSDGAADAATSGTGDIFLAKYSPSGALLWQHTIGSSGDDRARAIARDAQNNIYVTGSFQGTVDFNPDGTPDNLTSAGGFDAFVLKLTSTGDHEWARRFGGSSATVDMGYGITVDSAGDLLVTGQFGGTVDFNPTRRTLNLTSAGGSDIFVLKLTSGAGFIWAKRLGGSGADRGTAVTTDDSNRVYITGSFSGTADFNPSKSLKKLWSAGATDIFVSGLTSSGRFSFAKRFGGSSADEAHDIKVDSSGNILTTGYFSDTADFNPGIGINNLISAGGPDIFLSKLAADEGHGFLYAQRIGGAGDDRARGLVIGSDGMLAITGHFTGAVDFDPNFGAANLMSNGLTDVFVARFSSSGTFISAERFGGAGIDMGRGIARGSNNNLYLTGFFKGTVAFESGGGVFHLTSSGGKDIFVTKIVVTPGAVLSNN